jgi:ribosomal-protein-alanine N-acetyltransferase
MNIKIRRLNCGSELPRIVDIERECFEHPWNYGDFVRTLRDRNVVEMVAGIDGDVVGYVFCEKGRSRYYVINLAVSVGFRRFGIGSALIDKVKKRLRRQKRPWIESIVRETNLESQLFFRSQGFLAVDTIRGLYEDPSEDAYVFQYQMEKFVPRNRLKYGEPNVADI